MRHVTGPALPTAVSPCVAPSMQMATQGLAHACGNVAGFERRTIWPQQRASAPATKRCTAAACSAASEGESHPSERVSGVAAVQRAARCIATVGLSGMLASSAGLDAAQAASSYDVRMVPQETQGNEVYTNLASQVLPLDVLQRSLLKAREEMVSIRSSLELSDKLNAKPNFSEIGQRLHSGELSRIEQTLRAADNYVGERPMEDWEEQAWDTMKFEEAPDGYKKTTLTQVKQTNDFLCLVFSCFNDPRAPASTDTLLSIKMLDEGVRLGKMGNQRVNAEGMLTNVDDILEKMDDYQQNVDRLKAYYGK